MEFRRPRTYKPLFKIIREMWLSEKNRNTSYLDNEWIKCVNDRSFISVDITGGRGIYEVIVVQFAIKD